MKFEQHQQPTSCAKCLTVSVSGVTILLSLTVFLLLVAETMPPTSDAVPLIGRSPTCSDVIGQLHTWARTHLSSSVNQPINHDLSLSKSSLTSVVITRDCRTAVM